MPIKRQQQTEQNSEVINREYSVFQVYHEGEFLFSAYPNVYSIENSRKLKRIIRTKFPVSEGFTMKEVANKESVTITKI